MTGRRLFARFAPVLAVASAVLARLPGPVLRFLWSLSANFDGKVALALRYCIARGSGARLGQNVFLGPNVHISGFETLELGDNVSIHKGCYIDARGGIHIGNDVSVAHDCTLVSFDHSFRGDAGTPIKYLPLRFAPIAICDDVWLGAAVRVLAGSRVETRSVIGAGAIVKGHLEGHALYAGVPARRITTLEDCP